MTVVLHELAQVLLMKVTSFGTVALFSLCKVHTVSTLRTRVLFVVLWAMVIQTCTQYLLLCSDVCDVRCSGRWRSVCRYSQGNRPQAHSTHYDGKNKIIII